MDTIAVNVNGFMWVQFSRENRVALEMYKRMMQLRGSNEGRLLLKCFRSRRFLYIQNIDCNFKARLQELSRNKNPFCNNSSLCNKAVFWQKMDR